MTMLATEPSHASSRRRFSLGDSARYRWAVASRAVAAIGGGYALSALCAAALSLLLPLARVEAVLTGTLAAFVIYPCAVMWAFAARTAWLAWAGLAVPSAVAGAAVWLAVRSGGAA